jgi:catechol 2,3-dioxygenase-like lactoylglutathione lyase family enzyme
MAITDIDDQPWTKSNPHRVKLLGPACVQYGHPNLDAAHKFLIDFGFVEAGRAEAPSRTIFYRGYGTQPVVYIARETPFPEFHGGYYEAATHEDLMRATLIPGAGKVEALNHPGGGLVVHIKDPAGLSVHVVFGMMKRDFTPPPQILKAYNVPAAADADIAYKPRRGRNHGKQYFSSTAQGGCHQRKCHKVHKYCSFTDIVTLPGLKPGIVPIHKVGHIGYAVRDLDPSARFYTTHFNFKPTEVTSFGPPDKAWPGLMFFHIDLGQTYTDHHSLMLSSMPTGPQATGSDHSAFEVEGLDAEFIGHDYLTQQGYKLYWGVGRHVEGSIVYDYWYDVDGFLLEHYTDSDLVNEDTPIHWAKPRENASSWGPPPPMEPLPAPGGGVQPPTEHLSTSSEEAQSPIEPLSSYCGEIQPPGEHIPIGGVPASIGEVASYG